ncbi:beta-ketoadipyl-CoA thiolase [Ditylenchus destructor]|nr:beta-ketoadipyl-CoA thiolase [Ditylenchus destructor]
MARNPSVDWAALDDVFYGCANQAGEDNRNVARMATLLAGLPVEVPGATVNRLCGSGLDAIGSAARAIRAGEAGLMLAGGVESMSRAPFVMGKADSAYSRSAAIYDTTIGWRFVNKLMKAQYGVDSMPETAENVATDFGIEREAQDRMAWPARPALWPRSAPVSSTPRSARSPFPRKRATPSSSPRTSIRAKPALKRWPSSRAWFAKAARSPPATPRASTMARPRCCWPTKRAPPATA